MFRYGKILKSGGDEKQWIASFDGVTKHGATTQTTPQSLYMTTPLGRLLTLPITPNVDLVIIGMGLQEKQRQICWTSFWEKYDKMDLCCRN